MKHLKIEIQEISLRNKEKFKLTFHPLSQMVLIVAGILALFSLVSIGFIDVQYILLIDAAAILVFLFMAFPNIGIYLMALLFPFWGLNFVGVK